MAIRSHPKEKTSILDAYYDIIKNLLIKQNTQVFFYKRILWQYLTDNHGLKCSQSHFRKWITQHKEFDSYFNGRTNRTVNGNLKNCSSNHQSNAKLNLVLKPSLIGKKI